METIKLTEELLEAAKEALEFIDERSRGLVLDVKDSLRIDIAKFEGRRNGK